MIRPNDLELWDVELLLEQPLASAAGTTTARRSVIIRAGAGELVGWGEAATHPGQTRDDHQEAWQLLMLESARILGGSDPELITGSAATSALDQAITMLQAAAGHQSLADHIGGSMEPIAASAAIGLAATPADLIGAVAKVVDMGYRHVKLKTAPGRSSEIAAVRQHFPGLGIAVDGNGSFGRADRNELVELSSLELDYIEQPLPAANLQGHADLQLRIDTPICVDESIRRLGDIVTVATAGAAQAVVLKPGRLGPTLTARGFTLATRHGLGVKIGGLVETGIGKHHLVALATHPSVSLPSDLAGSRHWFSRDLVDPPWELAAGELHPRSLLTVDRDALAAATVRHHRFHR